MDDNFKDKTVIITGGSLGVGAAAAARFADAGANLVLVARSKKNLERMAEKLRPKTRVETISMDVTDTAACVNLFKKAAFEFGGIHILVNNAGFHERGPAENIATDDLGKIVDVNLKAPIILSRLAIPYLRKSGGGVIINVGSLAGRTPVPGAATYSASKAGLRAFTLSLAEELRDAKIKVAVVSPGPIDTGFIMSNIENVTDLTFSQPICTADEVADEIMKLCLNDKRERSMPPISGFLTTITYLFPGFGRMMRPLLECRGRRVKRKLIAQKRAAQE
ncbi:MAG: SDR family oxidoreductase [Gammaproteobacteria bacterium]|nr:MAG: SDR family oxidoreductase [Gammaproteobacteria bacterium]